MHLFLPLHYILMWKQTAELLERKVAKPEWATFNIHIYFQYKAIPVGIHQILGLLFSEQAFSSSCAVV